MAKEASARVPWLDEKSKAPLIDQYAKKLETFVQAMADGKVTGEELKEQESRLASLMQEVEPLLDDATHEKVTRLLCELTAYDIMQMVHAMQDARPKAKFRG